VYLTPNTHLAVIGCKQCYLGSGRAQALLNIVNDLTLAHMVPSVSNRGCGCNNRHLSRTVLSPPRLWNCRPATTASAVRLSAKHVDLQMPISLLIFIHFLRRFRSRRLQPSTRLQALDAKPLALYRVASNCSYLCGASLKMVPLICTKLKWR